MFELNRSIWGLSAYDEKIKRKWGFTLTSLAKRR